MDNEELRYNENIDTADGRKVVGYAAVVDQPTVIFKDDAGNEYKEVFVHGCFDKTNMHDVVFRYNHNDSFEILARTQNNTLQVKSDEKGLYIEADLADTTHGTDIYKLIGRKDITAMSIGFTVSKDYYDISTRTRYIQSVDTLFDVSAVDFPAYQGTSLRQYKEAMDKAEDEDKRRRIIILSQE